MDKLHSLTAACKSLVQACKMGLAPRDSAIIADRVSYHCCVLLPSDEVFAACLPDLWSGALLTVHLQDMHIQTVQTPLIAGGYARRCSKPEFSVADALQRWLHE